MNVDSYGARIWVYWYEVHPGKYPAGAEENTFLGNEYYEMYHMDVLACCEFLQAGRREEFDEKTKATYSTEDVYNRERRLMLFLRH